VALSTHHLVPRLKKVYSHTYTPPMWHRGLLWGKLYLYLYLTWHSVVIVSYTLSVFRQYRFNGSLSNNKVVLVEYKVGWLILGRTALILCTVQSSTLHSPNRASWHTYVRKTNKMNTFLYTAIVLYYTYIYIYIYIICVYNSSVNTTVLYRQSLERHVSAYKVIVTLTKFLASLMTTL
jgi:hypothetical protein